jgi:pilus assembly protein CpaB
MKLALPPFPRFGKTTVVLGFALGIGIIAALAANRFLAGRIEAIEARSRGTMVDVVVARRYMAAGQVIDADSVGLRPVPRAYAHSNALTQDRFAAASGRKLAYSVQPGEMILHSLLQTPKPSTFSARVGPGRRAMTVAVDEINSISGLLEPGDAIDLIAGLERKGRKLTMPLLQGVQVMATGQRVVDDPVTGERRQYTTVTLDLSPAQARALIAARDGGKITALLRNPRDRQAAAGEALDLAALPGDARGMAGEVPVLYGGSTARLPPEALRLGAYKAGSDALAAMAAVADNDPAVKAASATPVIKARAAEASSAAAVPVSPVPPVPVSDAGRSAGAP